MKLPAIPKFQHEQEAILRGKYYHSWRISQIVTFDMLKGWVTYPKFVKLSDTAIRVVDDFVPCDKKGNKLADIPISTFNRESAKIGSKCHKSNISLRSRRQERSHLWHNYTRITQKTSTMIQKS